MSATFYFIIAALVFIIACTIALIHIKRHKGPNVTYDNDVVIVNGLILLILSVAWFITIPVFVLGTGIYYLGSAITKWLNK